MIVSSDSSSAEMPKPAVLHFCKRQILRPLRDEILRLSGFKVDSTLEPGETLANFRARRYDLVLVDVEGESSIPEAEALCGELKTEKPEQLVAFVCNWRVAVLSDCPDDVVRTEFNPDAFVKGVQDVLARH